MLVRDNHYVSDTLEITENGMAYLNASEVWGALRGMETFSQLIYQNNQGTVRFLFYI